MKARILTVALVTSLLLMQLPATVAQKTTRSKLPRLRADQWYVFVSPDGDFTLSFPQKPNREADEPGPDSVFQSYGLYTQNGMRFSINFSQLPMDPNLMSANEWTDQVEQSLLADDREHKRHVVDTRRIGKNAFEVEIWDAATKTGESLNYIRRTIFRRGKVYTLQCGSEIYGREADKSTCRRFLNSMHLIGKPSNSPK